jgi:putative Mg2+ transporter-C (MgtC) family protein
MLLTFIESCDAQINTWAAALGWPMEGVLRLGLAALAGGLVGIDREARGREAGFRTNILVCFGSALVMLVSIRFALVPWNAPEGINLNIDPARIAYGVMTGVGFLGAGSIVHNRGTVRGLTTAAALWCVAAVGLAFGFGMYLLSIIATVMVFVVLWLFDYFEDAVPRLRQRTITLRTHYHPGCVAESIQRMKEANVKVLDASFERGGDLSQIDIKLSLVFRDIAHYSAIERQIESEGKYTLLASEVSSV